MRGLELRLTLGSAPLRLLDSDQLLLHLPGGADQFVEPPEGHRLFLCVGLVKRLTGGHSALLHQVNGGLLRTTVGRDAVLSFLLFIDHSCVIRGAAAGSALLCSGFVCISI